MNLEVATLKLCDHCLGRLFGMRGHGLTNAERGRAIRVLYAMQENFDVNSLYPEKCELCEGLFDRLDSYAKYISHRIQDFEFETFMIGSRFSLEILEKEKKLQEEYGKDGESISREFNRELGKRVAALTGKEGSIEDPDITVIVDTQYDSLEIEVKPLLIYGRYRKLVRGIPQTKWPSGKYKESVEDIIAKEAIKLSGGEAHALHGMGREDIDALMLGNGRPFILEIKKPRKRKIDLGVLQEEVNKSGKVEIFDLRFAEKREVAIIKSAEPRKRYRVGIEVDATEQELVNALASLVGKIRQRTPIRVKHRRADRVRIRQVYDIQLMEQENNVWILEILAQSGTYIKELMHGDHGRTTPSLAEKLGKNVSVKFLDVIEILDKN